MAETAPMHADISINTLCFAPVELDKLADKVLEIIGPQLQAEGEYAGLRRAGDLLGKLLDQARVY